MSNPYWTDLVKGLKPYVPGEQPRIENLVKLNTNENPYGPSSKAIAAIKSAAGDNLRLYPTPDCDQLKETLATYYKIERNQVFVGNGSDEVLAHIFQAFFVAKEPILFPDITYSFYPVYCGLYGVEHNSIALAGDFSLRIRDYLRPNGGIIFPNPNAPTGMLVGLAEIDLLLKNNTHSVVVIDEAYIDFGGESAVSLIDQYPNLLVVQTLSKSRSLAGLRVGFAMGNAGLIDALERIKNSFNSYPLDQLAIAGACAAIEDDDYFTRTRDTIIASRKSLVTALTDKGFSVLSSAANFVMAKHNNVSGEVIAQQLRQRGVIVRHFNTLRIGDYLRITVGLPDQHSRLLEALDEVLG